MKTKRRIGPNCATTIEINGLQSLQLLSAGQALRMPSGFYRGVTHKRARQVIREIVGYCPKGKPEGGSMEAVLAWLGMTPAESESGP